MKNSPTWPATVWSRSPTRQSTRPCVTPWQGQGAALVGVIGSIGVRRDPQAVPALVKRLGDSDPEVAQAAARALGKIGTLDAVEALEKALPNDARPTGLLSARASSAVPTS